MGGAWPRLEHRRGPGRRLPCPCAVEDPAAAVGPASPLDYVAWSWRALTGTWFMPVLAR